MIVRSLLIAFILSSCSSSDVIEKTVGTFEITGSVVEARSKDSISSALVILTIPEGDSWSLPSSFLVGYTFSDRDGKFHIPADPKTVKNVRRANASIVVDAYHPDYQQAVEFVSSKNRGKPVTLKMKIGKPKVDPDVCSYNNKDICKIVEEYLDL